MNNASLPPGGPSPTGPEPAPPRIAPSLRVPVERRGSGWKVTALILGGLLVLSGLGNISHWLGQFGWSGVGISGRSHGLEEVLLEDHHAASKIAVLEIKGVISDRVWDRAGNNLVDSIQDQLDRARDDDRVKAVVLKVDSPGGEVMASDQINRAIRQFERESGKPVVASMGAVAASGGYYVSVPCRWLVANELTITGSIGVILHAYNYRSLLDRVGVLPQVYKSGRFKDMLSGEKEPDQVPSEERQMIQSLVDENFKKFKQVVAEGRKAAAQKNGGSGRPLVADWEKYADGRVFSGKRAYELGFVDELGDFDTAVKQAEKLAGIATANLVEYQQPFSFGDLFHLFGETKVRTLKIDWGFSWPQVKAGRPYFLWLPR